MALFIVLWFLLGLCPAYLESRQDGYIDAEHVLMAIFTSWMGPISLTIWLLVIASIRGRRKPFYVFKDKK